MTELLLFWIEGVRMSDDVRWNDLVRLTIFNDAALLPDLGRL